VAVGKFLTLIVRSCIVTSPIFSEPRFCQITGLRAGEPGESFDLRLSSLIIGSVCLVVAVLVALPQPGIAYMPPPDPCELVPLTYGPPPGPTCAGPPPPPFCGPCPPMKCYPRKIVGPPPCPMTVCWGLAPTPAAYKFAPPPACPPPPCAPPPCAPNVCAGPGCPR
jgi:hypothetical protein